MDRGPALRVTGGAALRRALRDADADLRDLTAVHRRVAVVVARAAAARAPRRTGSLAFSLKGTASRTRATVTGGGTTYAADENGGGRFRVAAPYAGPIHWGWPASSPKLPPNMRNLDRYWAIAPNPFVVAAARATESTWVQMYASEVSGIVDNVGRTADGRGA